MSSHKEYKMTISRTTIDKLGVKLYDKASAAVSELIANAYDGDAEEVVVHIPLSRWLATMRKGELMDQGLEIVVTDNGHGMTPDVINDFYLRVGTNPRRDPKRGSLTKEKGRLRIGRKGIGKLAPFGICKKIEVITAGGKETPGGYEIAHFVMDYDKIVEDTDMEYYPEIGSKNHKFSPKTGTTVRLWDFLYRRTPDEETFHRQVARRFGLELSDFKIIVRDTTTGNRSPVGPLSVDIDEDTKIVVDNRPVIIDDGTELPVGGWIAYAKDPYPNEEVAGIRVYARGKFVSNAGLFGLRAGFTGEYTIRSYLVGVISADWLDRDDHEDLIRSDRQDILWSSDWGMAFQKWGQALIKELGKTAYPARKRKIANRFVEISGLEEEASKRFRNKEIVKTAVKIGKIFGRGLNAENLKDADYVDMVKELSLSVAPHKTIVDKLVEVKEAIVTRPLEVIFSLLNDAKLAESASLGMIVKERLDAINELKGILPSALEGDLQRLLEGAPWIIDPRWTMLQANQTFKSLRERFEEWYFEEYGERIVTTTETDITKRPDFVMAHFGRNLEIVEIKRRKHKLENKEFDRIREYYERMEEFLEARPVFKEHFDKIHVVLICDDLNLSGTHLDSYNYYKVERRLTKKTWDEVIADTEKINEDFLAVAVYVTPD